MTDYLMPLVGNFPQWKAHLRKTSDIENFVNMNFDAPTNPLILINVDTQVITQAQSLAEKKLALRNKRDSDVMLYVWQGKTRTDVFFVDNAEDLARAF
jgi:hypothetical protein